ncbi:H(+)/Cl(-) exchange transporter 3 [Hypsibius exemplaris]|uniref:H(+)/Cl(-) exchange transporter 3 n=1 Tax=Hypsibius exemplaris TaxID=2072580 RepID=A0A1W0WZ35_HYPEX|nr:H(+)/Cl(-) exchange transporter 3 [Hypsibius exemplaris]
MDDVKWGSMDLNDLDSQRLGSQRQPEFNPFDVEMDAEMPERQQPPSEVTIELPRGSSQQMNDYSFVSSFTSRAGREGGAAKMRFTKYDDFHTIDWLRDNAMDRERHRRFNKAKKQSSLDWLRSGMDASSAWICVFLVGLACGVCASILDIGTAWLIDLRDGICADGFWFNREQCCWGSNETGFDDHFNCSKWQTWSTLLGHIPDDAGAYVIQYMMYIIWAVVFAWMAAILVRVFAPYASGSGIPEIKTILSGFIIRGYLGKWTLLIKVVSLIFIVSSGVNVGKEGPMIHIAACCGNIFAYLFPKYGKNEAKKREIHSAAAAAGISVAFGAPIAGVLFSLEEISYYFPLKTLYRSFFCALVAAFIVRSINPFGNDHLTMFFVEVRSPWFFLELIPFILLGILGGVIGVVFIRANTYFCRLRKTTRLGQYPILEVVAMGFVTALVSYPIPFTRDDNSNLIAKLFRDCGPADVSDLCDYNRTYTSVTAAFDKGHPQDGIRRAMWQLFLTFIIKLVLSIMSVGMKIPAGIFIPKWLEQSLAV